MQGAPIHTNDNGDAAYVYGPAPYGFDALAGLDDVIILSRWPGESMSHFLARARDGRMFAPEGADQTIDGTADPRARVPARQGSRPPSAAPRSGGLDAQEPERTLAAVPSMDHSAHGAPSEGDV